MPAILRSDSAREKQILRFLPAAKQIAICWGSNADTREEAEADCYLALVKIIDATTDENLTKTFVTTCLRNRLRDLHRRTIASTRIPAYKMIYLDAPLEGGDDSREEFLSGHDVITDEKAIDPEAAMISKLFVHEMLAKLPVRQRKVISRYAGLDGMDPTPMTRVARALAISRALAYEELKLATDTLRTELTKLGYAPSDSNGTVEVLRNAA